MIGLATVVYLGLFQAAAWPAVLRVLKRGSSHDLSVWREWLILTGIVVQFTVMLETGASWHVLAGPIVSFCSLAVLLAVIYRHR